MRKSLILWLVFMAVAISCRAQDVCIGVNVPLSSNKALSRSAAELLAAKLNTMLAKNGVASIGGDFLLIPSVNVTGADLIEGGLTNVWRVDAQMQLGVYQLSTKKMYDSMDIELRGVSKKSQEDAVRAGIAAFNPASAQYAGFIESVKKRIVDYYTKNKGAIIAKAKSLAATQQYEEAIAILAGFPETMPGYAEVSKMLTSVYKAYSKKECSRLVEQARAAISLKNYDEAASILSTIDGSTPCQQEVKSLAQQIGTKIEQDINRERQDAKDEQAHQERLVKMRLNATRDIARTYYSRTQPTYNLLLVR